MNTLLQYRFVKKTSEPLSHNGAAKTQPHDVNNSGADSRPTDSINNTPGNSQDSTTMIPESPVTSLPTSPTSPVIGRPRVVRPMIYESDESQEPASSPWLSKQTGRENHFTNGSSSIQKLKKFRRLKSVSDSDSDDTARFNITPAMSQQTLSQSSSQSSVTSGDTRTSTQKINDLKAMFPIRATSQLAEAVDLFNGDFESIVTALMDGKFDKELVDRKRKRETNAFYSSPEEGRVFKRIRLMPNSDSVETVSSDSSQSTYIDSQTRDQRLAVMVETFPDYSEQVLLKALEDTNWSTEDAVLSLATVSANGTDTSKVKKKDKKKSMTKKDEEFSDEDDDYFEEGWDSEDSMEEEEAMGQSQTILSFFEDATIAELMTVPGCSKKKAELILSLRPFKSWDVLVEKFNTIKSLSYNLVSGCKETIHVRTIVTKLMKRCEKIAEEMESVVTTLTDPTKADSDRITKQPSLLTETFVLKPYQMIGLNWLRIMHTQELNGILADEMGLGKTIQTIAFLAHLIEQGDTGPHVIIVPSSTLDNWLREAKNWCPSMKVTIYYGSMDERRYVRHRILMEGNRDFNVLLTTYNIATGSIEDRSLFKKCSFHYAVFDEGHMLKNMASLRFQNLMKIRAERRLLLTGTPLQNNLVELMSLLCFVMPDLFIGKTEPLKKIFAMIGRQAGEENQGRYEKSKIAQAKRIMKPFLLRRLKNDIWLPQIFALIELNFSCLYVDKICHGFCHILKFDLDLALILEPDQVLSQLPKKREEVCRCPMIPDQQELYESFLKQYSQQMEVNDNPSGGMSMFMNLRKISNHPLLVRNIYSDEKLKAMSKLIAKEPSHRDRGALPHLIQEDMAVLNDFDINNLCKQYKKYVGSFQLEISQIKQSGKFQQLDTLLDKYQSQGDRVLLFSQFVMMLDIMEPYLQDKGIRYLRLDGSTPVPERQRMIDEYNNDQDILVFLLSTRAGGLGINLTAANVVILHDIDFNPYNDKQAEDRCHRLGQTREVQIVRLVSQDTVEEAMLRCAQEKLRLEKDVTTSDKGDNEDESNDVLSLLKEAFVKYKKKTPS